GVDDPQRPFDALVSQVDVEVWQLRLGEHALVDEGPWAEGGEVHRLGPEVSPAGTLGAELVLTPFAHHKALALEREVGERGPAGAGGPDEDLHYARLRVAGDGPDRGIVDRHLPPPDHGDALLGGDAFDHPLGVHGEHAGLREKTQAGGI